MDTIWLCDNEDRYLEWLEAYKEARRQVDENIPRKKFFQTEWIWNHESRWIGRWYAAHKLMQALEEELAE